LPPENPDSEIALNDIRIKKEIQDTDIQDALFIIPALANIMPYNDFREEISRQTKRFVFSGCFLFSFQRVSRLDVGFSSSARCDKINLPGDLNGPTGFILLGSVNNANIDFTAANTQVIVDDVFHDMRHFLLAKTDSRVPQPDVIAVILVWIVKTETNDSRAARGADEYESKNDQQA